MESISGTSLNHSVNAIGDNLSLVTTNNTSHSLSSLTMTSAIITVIAVVVDTCEQFIDGVKNIVVKHKIVNISANFCKNLKWSHYWARGKLICEKT
jgi:hypothetical protein